MKIKALVFDMDDTLYLEKEFVISGFYEVDKWIKERYKKTGFYETAILLFNLGERKFIFNKVLDNLKIIYDQSTINEMLIIYRTHEPNIHLLEETEWIFSHLIDSVKLGLISDGFLITQKKKVNALKLEEKFHSIVLSDVYGKKNWKPSKVPYEQAIKELQCFAEECVYIGDNLQKDFVTAKKLRWTTVHINRKEGIHSNISLGLEYNADYQINDLRQLSCIEKLEDIFIKKYNTKEVC